MHRPPIPLPVVLKKLDALYDPPKTFLHFRTPFDLLVVTILSAQCTDKRVNEVSKTLFKKYRKPEDYLKVSRAELERDIHSCGTYRNKARFIHELCALLLKRHQGKVPQTMEELTSLPGVGRKTASIILSVAFGKNESIAVDTHVLRVAQRLGLSKHTNPDKVSDDLMRQSPQKEWGRVTTLLISHGRAVCTARNRRCGQCVFQKKCPSSVAKDIGEIGA
jgi:endonuclease-3